jgi:hypothetical protein
VLCCAFASGVSGSLGEVSRKQESSVQQEINVHDESVQILPLSRSVVSPRCWPWQESWDRLNMMWLNPPWPSGARACLPL